MNTNQKCAFCSAQKEDIAWMSCPTLDSKYINSNINGTLPISDERRHEGFLVKIKDYGHLIDESEKDIGYVEYIQKNPGSLEIRSEQAGKKLFPLFQNNPLIIEISINYCPICGRKLGITSMDT